MGRLFVIDTNSLINYFNKIFGEKRKLSSRAVRIIKSTFDRYSNVRLIIPSIVFIEIFRKWFKNNNEELAKKIYYEIFCKILDSPNIEIKPIEKEVIEHLIAIDQLIVKENHDRIILASAMMMECSLITWDPQIIKYVKRNKVIPSIIT